MHTLPLTGSSATKPMGWALKSIHLLVLGGCASAGHDAEAMRERPPVPFRIAVAAVEADAEVLATLGGASIGIPFAYDMPSLQMRLVDALRSFDTATAVVMAQDLSDPYIADLELRPRLRRASFRYSGTSTGDALLSSLLWITTWAGGLFVSDCDYQAHLDVEWEIVNPAEDRIIDVVSSRTDHERLAFLDRNSFFELGTLQTLLIPPAFTSDSESDISAELSSRAADRVAATIARYLKSDMAGNQRDLIGELRLDSPRNHSVFTSHTAPLRGRVAAGALIRRLSIVLNGATEPILDLGPEDLPSPSRQAFGSQFQIQLPTFDLPLTPGLNELRFYLTFGGTAGFGEVTSARTVLVTRSGGEQ